MKYVIFPLLLTAYLIIEKAIKLIGAAIIFLWHFSLNKKYQIYLWSVQLYPPFFIDYNSFDNPKEYYKYFLDDKRPNKHKNLLGDIVGQWPGNESIDEILKDLG